jgi:hypothetical protein
MRIQRLGFKTLVTSLSPPICRSSILNPFSRQSFNTQILLHLRSARCAMHVCHLLLALLLPVVPRAAAQIIITPPETIFECEQTTFTWLGGDPPYSFYYGAGHQGFGNDDGVETETLVKNEITGLAVVFYAPSSGPCLISLSCLMHS